MKIIKFINFSFVLGFLFFCSSAFAMSSSNEEDCDLRRTEVLRPLLSIHYQEDEYVSKAVEIARSVFESPVRPVGGSKYGMVFPIHPEVLKELMMRLKDQQDKVVLEIAGASGDNALLLAFAGPGKVYLNDIEDDEIAKFESIKGTLPPAVQLRLESIGGSVFDILEKKPNLRNNVDHILCRNFLHFLTDKQHAEFFENVLKPIIKPDGELIFTMNSPYNNDELKALLEKQPGATKFQLTRCLLTIFGRNNDAACHSFFEIASVCDEDLSPLDYTKKPIYEIENYECTPNFENIMTYDPDIQDLIANKITPQSLGSFENGRISILTNIVRAFTPENVSSLFERYGFQVEDTFLITKDGHRFNSKNPWEGELSDRPQQVGVIARWKQ